jgi:ribosomal protein L35
MAGQKTKKAISKRFHTNAAGTIYRGAAGRRHKMCAKHKDAKRSSKGNIAVHPSCIKLLKRCAPHGI